MEEQLWSQSPAAKWEKQHVQLAHYRGLKHISTVGSPTCRVFWVSQLSQAPPRHNISPWHNISSLSLASSVLEESGHRAPPRWEIQMFPHLFH